MYSSRFQGTSFNYSSTARSMENLIWTKNVGPCWVLTWKKVRPTPIPLFRFGIPACARRLLVLYSCVVDISGLFNVLRHLVSNSSPECFWATRNMYNTYQCQNNICQYRLSTFTNTMAWLTPCHHWDLLVSCVFYLPTRCN